MSHHGEAYSAAGAFFLDNAVRRWLQPPSELIEKFGITSDETIVDFGCGPGFFTLEAAKRAKKVVAVDLSPEMLAKAKKKADKASVKNIEFLQSDGKKVQLEDASVDLIFLVTVFHEVGEPQKVLSEFSRILKPTGKLVIVEVVKKGILPGAPVQNPEKLKGEVEDGGFTLAKIEPYKDYGVFFFGKKAS
jgi:ubiquinone/menaquinone biosynthesis C-methylase UbiE